MYHIRSPIWYLYCYFYCYSSLFFTEQRLADFAIGVMSTAPPGVIVPGSYELCHQYVGIELGNASITCDNSTVGRYLIVQIAGTNKYLTMCEVLVYAGEGPQ